MATLFVKLKIFAGKEAEFEDVARALSDATTAHEPGCRLYAYYRAPEPRTYYCLLVFDSYAAFLFHQASEHHESLITPRAAEFFEAFEGEWLDAVEGASNGVATEYAKPPADAPEREQFYAEHMPADIQDWWLPLR